MMQGRRVYFEPGHPFGFAPGDYGRDDTGRWWVRPPRGSMGYLDDHQVVEHDDGTITVSPSILLPDQWHGYLERGVWHEA